MSVVFSTPTALFGLAAAGQPIVIHLINRRRVRDLVFPPSQLLIEIARRRSRSLVLQQWLLLLLRTLVIVVLVLTVARPLLRRPRPLLAALPPLGRVAIVIDDSLSTGYRVDGEPLFSSLARGAGGLVDGASAGTTIAVTTASQVAAGGLAGFASPARGKATLETLREGYGRTDMAAVVGGLHRAAATAPLQAWILTDDTAASWDRFDAVSLGGLSGDLDLRVLVFPLPKDASTLGVVDVRPSLLSGRIDVTVANGGRTETGPRSLTVTVGNDPSRMFVVDPLPGERRTFSVPVAVGPERVRGEARVPPDALEADDAFFFRLTSPAVLPVLVINGRLAPPGPERPDYFLVRALSPGRRISPPAPLATREWPEGLPEDLGGYGGIVLAETPAPSPGDWSRLASFVTRGGGLLIYPSSAWGGDARPEAASSLAPPLPLARADFDPPAYLAPELPSDPLWLPFRPEDLDTVATVPVRALYRPAGAAPEWETLLSSTAGDPVLLRRKVGKGSVWWFLGGAGREGTELPLSPVFLPLVEGIVRNMVAGSPLAVDFRREASPARWVGDEAVDPPSGEGDLAVITPERISDLLKDLPGRSAVSLVSGSDELVPVDRDLVNPLLFLLIGLLVAEGWLSERRLRDGVE